VRYSHGIWNTSLTDHWSDWPLLEPRFADLKRSIIKPERKQKVIDFYKQLLIALQKEAALIASVGPAMVPEVDFELVRENGTFS
jgi:hypothetical protein